MNFRITTKELNEALFSALESIITYESDTFSASNQGLTRQDVEKIIAILLNQSISNVDGIQLSELIEQADEN